MRGHEVHVVTYHLGDLAASPHYHLHRIAGPAWYRRTTPGPTFTKLAVLDPMLARQLRRVLRRLRFDIIHAHHYEGLLTALAANRGRLPVVFDTHTLLESELPDHGPALMKRLMRATGAMLDRHLPRRADRIIAVSEEIRLHLAGTGAVDPGRVCVISNGVEIDHFRGDGSASVEPEVPDVLAFAGNLARYQRVDLLLEAFAIVAQRRPMARLQVLTGDDFGGYAAQVERLGIADRIDVFEVGYAALPAHLIGATVLANPRIECSGIPQKLLNYMASGTPVVSFEGSGRLLAHGETGLLVRDGDVQGFAAAVLRLMDDAPLRAELGLRAQRVAARDHSWETVAASVEAVYTRELGLR